MGDLIYALASIEALGGGDLYLTTRSDTRTPMSKETLEFLRPLLENQPYIRKVQIHLSETIKYDFTEFRKSKKGRNLAEWQADYIGSRIDVKRPWLTVPSNLGLSIINRSMRYRNPIWDEIWPLMLANRKNAVFVGLEEEHQDFVSRYGPIHHEKVENALQLAVLIASAPIFIGNQSFPYSIAEAVKTNRIQESYPDNPDCIFEKENSKYILKYSDLTSP